jgi:hypothetical protein
MLRLVAPLLEGALSAALADSEFCAWVTATAGAPVLAELDQVRRHLCQLCRERGW